MKMPTTIPTTDPMRKLFTSTSVMVSKTLSSVAFSFSEALSLRQKTMACPSYLKGISSRSSAIFTALTKGAPSLPMRKSMTSCREV